MANVSRDCYNGGRQEFDAFNSKKWINQRQEASQNDWPTCEGVAQYFFFFLCFDSTILSWLSFSRTYSVHYRYVWVLAKAKEMSDCREDGKWQRGPKQGRFSSAFLGISESQALLPFLLLASFHYYRSFRSSVDSPADPSRSSYFPHNAPYTRQFMRRNVLNTWIHSTMCVRVEFLAVPGAAQQQQMEERPRGWRTSMKPVSILGFKF